MGSCTWRKRCWTRQRPARPDRTSPQPDNKTTVFMQALGIESEPFSEANWYQSNVRKYTIYCTALQEQNFYSNPLLYFMQQSIRQKPFFNQ